MRDQAHERDGDDVWATLVQRHAALAGSAPAGEIPMHRPEAAILACSDARVPPSLVFGQQPGSLFVVRLAGNSATRGAIASLTYAVEALGVGLVIVLGHTDCGAVTAALERGDGALESALAPILTPIAAMLEACAECGDVDAAVHANVRHNVDLLTRDPGPLGAAARAGQIAVHGAVHDLTTGELIPSTATLELTRNQP